MWKKIEFIVLLNSLISIFVSGASNFISETQYIRHTRQSDSTKCILPPYPDHGSWRVLNGEGSPGEKVLVASVITFSCKSGYKLSTKIPLVCLGRWSSPVPECEELCPPLYPSNTYDLRCIDKIGREVNCSKASHGTNLEYTCKTFYETPFGYKKTLFCENGKWDKVKPICQPVCGRKIDPGPKPLIVSYGSRRNERLESPWIAAVFKKMNESYANVCGGTILSQTVVLTAAHCVTNDFGDVLPKEDYIVGVGKLYITYQAPEDKHAQYLEIFKIIVPEEYKADIRKFAADIAVLVVKKEITLSVVVSPICFTNMKNIHLHAGDRGETSGWGFEEGQVPSDVLKTLLIPYKYEPICANELPSNWADKYNLKDKICAGFVNKGKGVCTGDSGSGFVFKYREDDRYYIHGIVSLSHQVGYMCNVQQNALYTRVASYYEFVDQLLTKYAPKIRDCVLPPFPENGKWTIDEQDAKPGDAVPSNTVLNIMCDRGSKLSSSRRVDCSSSHQMPTCHKLCPKLQLPKLADHRCTNRDGQQIDCSTATDGTNLWYSCPSRFKQDGSPNRTCVQGSWGSPNPDCVRECGKKIVDNASNGLEHPWNVAIYRKLNNTQQKYEYVCGGSLISEFVVVTAAQCITDEQNHPLSKDDYAVAVGKMYRRSDDPRDTKAQFANITYIIVHPRVESSNNLYRNIAFLVVSSHFVLNSFVQPICIVEATGNWWDNGEEGLMVGWRFNQESLETIQTINIVLTQKFDCQVNLTLVGNYTSFDHDKICTKFKNESTCFLPEDRGKGIIRKHPEDDRYYLHAVATSYKQRNDCHKYFFNTGIQRYAEFIYGLAIYLN